MCVRKDCIECIEHCASAIQFTCETYHWKFWRSQDVATAHKCEMILPQGDEKVDMIYNSGEPAMDNFGLSFSMCMSHYVSLLHLYFMLMSMTICT